MEGAEAAEATAKPWAAKMLEAKRMVIDPNMEQLAEHLKAMRADQLDAMARDVRRMPSNVQQAHLARKATSAQRVLQAALDDVKQAVDAYPPGQGGIDGGGMDGGGIDGGGIVGGGIDLCTGAATEE